MRRYATNGVDGHHLDDLAQRKRVEIHEVCWGNKWICSLDLNTLNKDEQVKQLAEASK